MVKYQEDLVQIVDAAIESTSIKSVKHDPDCACVRVMSGGTKEVWFEDPHEAIDAFRKVFLAHLVRARMDNQESYNKTLIWNKPPRVICSYDGWMVEAWIIRDIFNDYDRYATLSMSCAGPSYAAVPMPYRSGGIVPAKSERRGFLTSVLGWRK